MTEGRHGLAAVTLSGRIYAIGGSSERGWSHSSTNEIYQT